MSLAGTSFKVSELLVLCTTVASHVVDVRLPGSGTSVEFGLDIDIKGLGTCVLPVGIIGNNEEEVIFTSHEEALKPLCRLSSI